MDAGLALHLRSVGHDPRTGAVARPEALPADEISGCGSAACTPHDEGAQDSRQPASA
jgi:hypothetical protein